MWQKLRSSVISGAEIKKQFWTKYISFSSHEKEVTAFVQMLNTASETGTKKAVHAFDVLMAGGKKYVKKKPQSRLQKFKIIIVVACFC